MRDASDPESCILDRARGFAYAESSIFSSSTIFGSRYAFAVAQLVI